MGTSKKEEKSLLRNKRGVLIGYGIIAFFIFALILRLAYIQLINDDFYKKEAASQQTNDEIVDAKRGDIRDRNGVVLATSVTSYSLSCNSTIITEKYKPDELHDMAEHIAEIVYMEPKDVYNCLVSREEEQLISEYLSLTQVNDLKALDYSGLRYKSEYNRYYPFGDFASQLLGSMTMDDTGRSGLEMEYEEYLSGIDGRWVKLTDVNGNELEGSDSSFYDAQNGLNLMTTIDSTIQFYVEEAIKNCQAACNPKRVLAIVMNPNTGEILASAVTDGFDPNSPYTPSNEEQRLAMEEMTEPEMVDFVSYLWRNPIVSDVYELGSIFKPFVASMILEEEIMGMEDQLYCDGTMEIGEDVISCSEGEIHGWETITDAIADSCNMSLAQMIFKLGRTKFYEYLDAYGLTSRTGIDYPAESSPLVKNKSYLADIDLANSAFGQGIAFTPVGYLTAANAIVNGGYLVSPKYVSSLVDDDGNDVVTFDTNVIRQVISKETCEQMREVFEYTATYGTAKRAYVPGYRVGGKTGTAEKAVNGEYTEDLLSYVGFAPMNNPQVSILLVIDEPEYTSFSAVVAAPVVREILENTLPYLGVEPDYSEMEEEYVFTNKVEVPSVIGMKYLDAKSYLEGYGFEVEVADEKVASSNFEITAQYPLSNSSVAEGSTVYLYRG